MDWSCWQPKHLTEGLSWQHAFGRKKPLQPGDFHSSPRQQKNNTSNTPTMSQAPFIQMEPPLSSAKGIYHGLKQDQGLCDKSFSGLKKFWTWRYHLLNICALKVSLPLHSQSVLTHNMFPLQQFYWSLHCRSFSKKPSSLPTIGAPHKEGSGLGALMNHLHSGSDPLSNLDISSIHTNICCHLIRKYQIILKSTPWENNSDSLGHWVQMFRWSWHIFSLPRSFKLASASTGFPVSSRQASWAKPQPAQWRVREKNGY